MKAIILIVSTDIYLVHGAKLYIMAKPRTLYICAHCGAQHPKWQGKCDSCGEWNSLQEELVAGGNAGKSEPSKPGRTPRRSQAISIREVQADALARMKTQEPEFDRVLGGGLVPGGVSLIGGQPGIGKSTLLLQMALKINAKVLYVSGEESIQQIKMRADRLIADQNPDCLLLSATEVEQILKQADDHQPQWMIIDSIQTLNSLQVDSTPGSITQIRECTAMLTDYAKEHNVPVTLIGHITKEGVIAGPKLLEHMVDCVLQFEGDRQHAYRLLRSIKNRFGSTDELGIYEMRTDGLRAVENPSMILMENATHDLSGSAIAASLEGIRPMMVEVQALVSSAVYGTPQRSTTGFELNRLHMLLAVLEKRVGFFFNQQDVFLNIAGGFRVSDPSMDLAVIIALVSSFNDEAVLKEYAFCGEVGLSGEIRPIARAEIRILEAERMGFRKIYLPHQNLKKLDTQDYTIECIGFKKIDDLIGSLFD